MHNTHMAKTNKDVTKIYAQENIMMNKNYDNLLS